MKPVSNPRRLLLCPRSGTCRNCRKFTHRTVDGSLCGHHIPHQDVGSCRCPECGEERDAICQPIEEVLK